MSQNFEALNFRIKPKAQFQDDAFCQQAADLFEDGATKAEAAEKLGVNPAVAHLAWSVHKLGRIPFKSQADLAKKVVKERDGGQPWAIIGARAGGMSEARVQALYEEGAGKPYVESRISRGGRQRTEPRQPESKPKAAKPAPKKRTGKKATKRPASKVARKR
jgi:hypothetical protein